MTQKQQLECAECIKNKLVKAKEKTEIQKITKEAISFCLIDWIEE